MRRLVLIAGLLGVMTLGGCAVGRGADGGPVVGFRLGPQDPQTITEAGAIASTLFPQFAPIIGVATAALGGIFGTYAHAKRKGERAGWDEAVGTPAGVAPVAGQPVGVPASVPAVPVAAEVTA